MSYVDGFILPLPNGKEDEYQAIAQKFAVKAEAAGAIVSVESVGDGLEHGHTTDFYRAVQATEDENVVFSFIVWPDKETRDKGWEQLMADPEMTATQMPFDGKRMFWGGFRPIVNTMEKQNA